MLLDAILEQNRAFVRGRESRPFPAPEQIQALFVACYDPRLDPLLRPALGIVPEKSILLRTAGALVRPDGDPLRSITLGVHLFGVTDVYVVGHAACRMAAFSSPAFIDAFRARGVPREAFGAQDLREWTGAFNDPKLAIEASVRTLASAPTLPSDLVAGGLLLDETNGALEVIVQPTPLATLRSAAGAAAASPLAASAAAPEPAKSVAQGLPSEPPAAPEHPPAEDAVPPDLAREVDAIRAFVSALETTAGWREEIDKLRQEIDRQRSPLAKLTLIDKFLRRSTVNARGVAAAYERLKKELTSPRQGLGPDDLISLFRRLGRKR
jgi:carbonic anhydrase